MSILFIMIPLSVLLAFTFLGFFIWSNNSGQFDDLDGASLGVLDEEDILNHDKGIKNERRSL